MLLILEQQIQWHWDYPMVTSSGRYEINNLSYSFTFSQTPHFVQDFSLVLSTQPSQLEAKLLKALDLM